MNGTERPTPLLLIHGFPLDSRMWRGTVAWFDGIRPVYAPDLATLPATRLKPMEAEPEVGASVPVRGPLGIRLQLTEISFPLGSMEFTLADLARDLAKCLPTRKAVVVGLSMGGYIALEMWKAAPERFAGIVLADTKAEADTPEARAGRDAMIDAIAEKGVVEATVDLRKKLTSPMAIPSARDEIDRIIAEQGAGWQTTSFVIACQKAMRDRPDNVATLETIDVPALVVVGQEDAITPPELSRHMAARLPKSRLEVIPRAGHMSPMERSREFNTALEAWLTEQGL